MPPLLTFGGFSKSGKTTLISGLVKVLARRGIRVGVVKHHGHPGPIAAPGKDSDRFLEAGAEAVSVSGPGREVSFRPRPGDAGPAVAAAGMAHLDLILVEGFKTRPGFKIEVLAPGAEPRLFGDPLLLALAGPKKGQPWKANLTWLDSADFEAAADFIIDCFWPPGRLGPVPDKETCFALMARYDMRPNIMLHSLVVTEAASRLAAALIRAGKRLDLPLIEAGALLHDIAKTECLHQRCDHAERGFEILAGLGYPDPAEVVADHVDPERARGRRGLVSPGVVVNYADKRVLHDRVVPLKARLEDLMRRYGIEADKATRLKRLADQCASLEAELFEGLDIGPEDVEKINSLFEDLE